MQHWYLAKDGQQYGPIDRERLLQLNQDGEIGLNDLVWTETMDQWERFGTVIQQMPDAFPSLTPPAIPDEDDGTYAGLGGWLLLLAFGLVAYWIYSLIELFGLMAMTPLEATWVIFNGLLSTTLLFGFFARKRWFPVLAMLTFLLFIVQTIIFIVRSTSENATGWLTSSDNILLGPLLTFFSDNLVIWAALCFSLLLFFAPMIYLKYAKRVRQTFTA